jgi:hypothetical protein
VIVSNTLNVNETLKIYLTTKVKIVKNERDPPLFIGKLLIKFQNILRNTTQVIIRHRIKILFSNVLVMEIGWTDVGSGGYILVSCAHSNTSFDMPFG